MCLRLVLLILVSPIQAAAAANGFSGGLMSIPFTATPLVISYNLPTTAIATGSYLTLDLPAVYQIFNNEINYWNHSVLTVRFL